MTDVHPASPATEDRSHTLRLALRLDALASGAMGLLLFIGGPWLVALLGPSTAVLQSVGLFLVVFAAGLGLLARRPVPDPRAVWAVITGNEVWVVASLAVVAAGLLPLTGPGTAFVLLQAAAVAVFATLQFHSARRAARPTA